MIREELALVKQNGCWKLRRKKRIIWPFLPSKWVKSSVLLINFFFVDPSPLLFYFNFFIRLELIWIDPTRTGSLSWSGLTFVPAYWLWLRLVNKYETNIQPFWVNKLLVIKGFITMYMAKRRTFSCGTNIGTPKHTRCSHLCPLL